MPTVYCYPVKLTIADLSREKHMLTDSVQPYNKPIIDLACSVCNVKYQTSLLHRSVHTKKPRSHISQYRPYARSISLYYINTDTLNLKTSSTVKCMVWRLRKHNTVHYLCWNRFMQNIGPISSRAYCIHKSTNGNV